MIHEAETIEWHKDNYQNAILYTEKEMKFAEQQLIDKQKRYAETLFYKYQIDCAIKEKKKKFTDKYKQKHREDFVQQTLSKIKTSDSV